MIGGGSALNFWAPGPGYEVGGYAFGFTSFFQNRNKRYQQIYQHELSRTVRGGKFPSLQVLVCEADNIHVNSDFPWTTLTNS
jgi:hypothetical protein